MKLKLTKKMIWMSSATLLLAVAIGLGCSVLIHSLGNILRGAEGLLGKDAEVFGAIFDQLKRAEVELPSMLILFLCLLEVVGIGRVLCGKKGAVISKKSRILRIAAIVLPAIIGLVLIMMITLWFTDVNEIRFGTVAKFLYDALQHGVF